MTNLFYNNLRRYGWLSLFVLIVLVQWWINIKVNYPPLYDQIDFVLGSLNLSRLLALPLFLGSLLLISWYLGEGKQKIVKNYFYAVLLVSPLISGWWLLNFSQTIVLVLSAVLITIFRYVKQSWFFVGVLVLILVAVNGKLNGLKPQIFVNNQRASLTEDVNRRFADEDGLKEKIPLPLFFRRIAYNKYSFLARNVLKEAVGYVDIELLFFQEFSPGSRKGMVPFFWILIIPFAMGIYRILNQKGLININRYFGVSFGYYLFSSGDFWQRQTFTLILVGWIVAEGMVGMNGKILNFGKWLILAIMFYGFQLNLYDFYKRPDFWLDNRPIFYKNTYQFLKENPTSGKVVVSDRLGKAEKYCRYYLKNCQSISFSAFEMRKEVVLEKSVLYAGFLGEFVGKDINNKFENDKLRNVSNDFKVMYTGSLRDSIVWGYGDTFLIAMKL